MRGRVEDLHINRYRSSAGEMVNWRREGGKGKGKGNVGREGGDGVITGAKTESGVM